MKSPHKHLYCSGRKKGCSEEVKEAMVKTVNYRGMTWDQSVAEGVRPTGNGFSVFLALLSD